MSTELDSGTVKLLLSVFAINSLAGLAALLRSRQRPTLVQVISAMLYSGLIGLAIFMVLLGRMPEEIVLNIGVSVLAGLGGASLLDFLKAGFQQGGINVHVDLGPRQTKNDEETDDAS